MDYKCLMCDEVFEDDGSYDKGECCCLDDPFYERKPKSEKQCEECRKNYNNICDRYMLTYTKPGIVDYVWCPHCGSFVVEKLRKEDVDSEIVLGDIDKIKKDFIDFEQNINKENNKVRLRIGEKKYKELYSIVDTKFASFVGYEKTDKWIEDNYPYLTGITEMAIQNMSNRALQLNSKFGQQVEYDLYIIIMKFMQDLKGEDHDFSFNKEIIDGEAIVTFGFLKKQIKSMN